MLDMRALLVVGMALMGCVSASTTPLGPAGTLSEPAAPTRNKVASSTGPAPDKAHEVEPAPKEARVVASASSAAPVDRAAPASRQGLSTTRLLDAGAAPRQELRYLFHRGESLRWRMRSEMTMDMTIEAPDVGTTAAPRTTHQTLPTTECAGTTITRAVDADGTAHRAGWIEGINVLSTPGVEPSVQAKLEEMLRGFGKLSFEETIDTRGQISESKLDLSSIHDPVLLQTMEQTASSMSSLTVPWPVEPVGIGAKWEVQSSVGKGQQLARTIVVTLSALHGQQVQLEMATTITGAPNNDVKNGVRVLRTEGGGSARHDVRLAPFSSQSHASFHTSTETVTNGVHLRMRIDTETDFHSET